MRVDDLDGALLDLWVGHAEHLDVDLIHACGTSYCRLNPGWPGYQVYVPTQNWTVLGPMIIRQKYLLYPRLDESTGKVVWLAEAQLNPHFHRMYIDARAELALCRLRVAERFGEEVSE